MSIIKVISRRIIYKKDYSKTKFLLNQLYKEASKKEGFLGASSFVEQSSEFKNTCNYNTIWTISDWASHKNWEDWFKDHKRKDYIYEHNRHVVKENHSITYRLKQNTFLL